MTLLTRDLRGGSAATAVEPGRRTRWLRALQAVIVAGLGLGLLYNLGGFPPLRRSWGFVYHLDLDVYRLAGAAFLDGATVYEHLPRTELGTALPFIYPPFAAVLFGPTAWLPLTVVGILMTVLSIAALTVSLALTIRSFGVPSGTVANWATGAAVAAAFVVEPIFSTLDFGQVNIVLMALVCLDCLLPKTWWPRGTLIGIAAAVKLTPIVFVLFLLLRKDFRAAVVSVASFAVCTGIGYLLAFDDSNHFWSEMAGGEHPLGTPTFIGNQSISAVLSRLGLSGEGGLWLALVAVLGAFTVVAMRRALRHEQIALALGINGVAGLLASPVAWSHHWVWAAPLMLAIGWQAYRDRSRLLALLLVVGAVMFHFAPHFRVGIGRVDGLEYSLWDQIVTDSYVWWGLAMVVIFACYRWRGTTERAPEVRSVRSSLSMRPIVRSGT